MNITLKKVKLFRGHDGVGLSTDVYVDGVKTFFFFDDARGGEPEHDVYNKEKYKELETYAASLPHRPLWKEEQLVQYEKTQEMLPVTIDDLVNEICDEMETAKAKAKADKKFQKDIEKKTFSAIVWGSDDHYESVSFKGKTIEQVVAHPKGAEAIRKVIADFKAKLPNDRLLNKNIPSQLL